MRRREFITLIGGAAAALPLTARAQQPVMPVIGFLSAGTFEKNRDYVAAFHRGANLSESWRQAGNYVGKILKGAKPGELPIMQSSKFELAINLKTAKVLGLTVSPGLLARADVVID